MWDALITVYIRTYESAPAIVRSKGRGRKGTGFKAQAWAAWTNAFQSDKGFRHWPKNKQIAYLRDHDDACRDADIGTLNDYVGKFNKEALPAAARKTPTPRKHSRQRR